MRTLPQSPAAPRDEGSKLFDLAAAAIARFPNHGLVGVRSTRRFGFGFSAVGLIASLVPMLPSVLLVLLPPVSSTLPANDSALPFIDAVGMACQSLMIALLIVVVDRRPRSMARRRYAMVGSLCLIGYFGLWVVYFTSTVTPLLLVTMAVLPSAYFVNVALFLGNRPALIPASLFALIHIGSTGANYLQLDGLARPDCYTAGTAPLAPFLVARTVVVNAIGGIAFGWLYWRRSLEAAMVAHAFAHVGFAIARPLIETLT